MTSETEKGERERSIYVKETAISKVTGQTHGADGVFKLNVKS